MRLPRRLKPARNDKEKDVGINGSGRLCIVFGKIQINKCGWKCGIKIQRCG